MKPIRHVFAMSFFVAALGHTAPAVAQDVICCNVLIHVNGPWVGASRSPQACTDQMKRDQAMRRYICNTVRAERGLVCEALEDLCKDVPPGPPGELPKWSSSPAAPASTNRPPGPGATAPARAATTSPAATRIPAGPLAFLVGLDTSGGFTGRGRGRATIASDGTISAARLGGAACEAQLRPEELASLKTIVAASVNEPWPPVAVPDDNGCCDRIKWTLRLERRGEDTHIHTYTTTWFDHNEPQMRKDVGEVAETVSVLMQKTLLNCQRE